MVKKYKKPKKYSNENKKRHKAQIRWHLVSFFFEALVICKKGLDFVTGIDDGQEVHVLHLHGWRHHPQQPDAVWGDPFGRIGTSHEHPTLLPSFHWKFPVEVSPTEAVDFGGYFRGGWGKQINSTKKTINNLFILIVLLFCLTVVFFCHSKQLWVYQLMCLKFSFFAQIPPRRLTPSPAWQPPVAVPAGIAQLSGAMMNPNVI